MRNWRIELVTDGGFFWRIVGANGEIVCHSQQYVTHFTAKRSAKRLAKMTGLALEEV